MVDVQRINDKLLVYKGQCIGKGSFGVVLRGEYDNAPCAVKVLHHTALEIQANMATGEQGQEEAIKAFERECKFLETIDHPNIVKHLSTSNLPKTCNILLVLELMDCNLRDFFSDFGEKLLTVYCQVSLSKDVASGLAYLHSRNIIHRDLCGDNILLATSLCVPIAKISDFGMSRLLDPSQMSSTLTAIGHRMGYLPPEAIRYEDEKYDNSLDVFSLGVVMVQIVHKLESINNPKDRSLFVQKIPETHALKASIFKCLEEQKDNRSTAKDLYHTLRDQLFLLESTYSTTAENQPYESEDHIMLDNLLDSDGSIVTTVKSGQIYRNDASQLQDEISISVADSSPTKFNPQPCSEEEDVVSKKLSDLLINLARLEFNLNKVLEQSDYEVKNSNLKNHCSENKCNIVFLVGILFIDFVLMIVLGGGYDYCRTNIERIGKSEMIQTKRIGTLLIGEVDPTNRQTLKLFQTGLNEISPVQFYSNDCDKVNTSQVPITIQDTFHPIASTELDVRHIQFDTNLMFYLKIATKKNVSANCFLKLLVFDDLEKFQIFLNRGRWSDEDPYTEVCVNKNNFSTNITLNETSYYYIGVHISSDSQQLIEGDIMYRISGIAKQYDIDSFEFACSMNDSRECQVHFSDIGVTATTTRVCILGYLPVVDSTETERLSIKYQTDGVSLNTLIIVLFALVMLGVVLVFGCVAILVVTCCFILRRRKNYKVYISFRK